MVNKHILLSNNQYVLQLISNVELDYYTDVTIELSTKSENKIIFKDNILYLKNLLEQYINNLDNYILDNRLDEKELGLQLNKYYYTIYEDIENNTLIKNKQGEWLGEKYCCFSTIQYATWLYKYSNKIILKVTPIFTKFENDNFFDEYSNFIKEYIDIFNIEITKKQLNDIFNIVLELNNNSEKGLSNLNKMTQGEKL